MIAIFYFVGICLGVICLAVTADVCFGLYDKIKDRFKK